MTDQPKALRLAQKLENRGLMGVGDWFAAELDAARLLREQHAEIERLRADAERYRWLRTNCYSDKYPYSEFDSAMQLSFTVSGIWANNRDPAVLDGCLDTAMGDKT